MADLYFGWALQSSHSGANGAAQVIAVNVILPGASGSPEWWQPAVDYEISVADALAGLGGLLYPWVWNDLALKVGNWQGFAWNAGGWTALGVTYTGGVPIPSSVSQLRTWAENWISTQAGPCKRAFSIDAQYTVNKNRSLPHALAPMTHLAPPLSESVLGTSMHFSVQANQGDKILVVPREIAAHVDKARSWKLLGVPQGDPAAGPIVVSYQEDLPPNERLTLNGQSVNMRFAAQPATIGRTISAVGPCTLTTSALNAVELRELVARYFHPAAVFAAAIDAGGNDAREVLAANPAELFAWSMGAGDIGVTRLWSGTPRRQMYPQLLFEPRRVQAVWNDGDITTTKVRAAAGGLCRLIAASTAVPRSIANFAGAPSSSNLQAALRAAITEAEAQGGSRATMGDQTDQAGERSALWGSWFSALSAQFLAGNPLEPELDNRLSAKLGGADRGFGRGAWLHRLSIMGGGNFWDALAGDDPATALLTARAKIVAEIQSQLGITITADAALKEAAEALRSRLSDASSPEVLHDPGLRIQFEDSIPSDQSIRGYAIALQAGTSDAAGSITWDDSNSAWITATSMVANDDKGVVHWVADATGPIFMHETIGSTFEAGMRAASVEYRGRPLTSALSSADGRLLDRGSTDGPEQRDFYVDNRSTVDGKSGPLLAYGAWYRSAAAVLDNAGGELGVNPAGNVDLGLPANRCKALPPQAALRYLSRVKPGAPSVSGVPIWRTELSSETRLHALWKKLQDTGAKPTGVPAPPVACLVPSGGAYRDAYSVPLGLAVCAPVADATFIERWFNRSVLEAQTPADKQARASERDAWIALSAQDRFHPAVRKVRLEMLDANGKLMKDAAGNPLTTDLDLGGAGAVPPQRKPYVVKIGNLTLTQTQATIPGGTFACLRFTTLVDPVLATPGKEQRFADDIATQTNGWWMLGATELWIEALTEPTALNLSDGWIALNEKDGDVVLQLQGAHDASFVRRFQLERHEWHWTGYDVRFPAPGSGNLSDLVSTLVNAASYRESVETVALTTDESFSAMPQVLHRFGLPAVRGARFVAFTARPVMRFRGWMIDSVVGKVEAQIIAAGLIVNGRAGPLVDRRVPVPAWSDAIPLCQTYEGAVSSADSGDYGRVTNGNLLVFDEAIRRTDELAVLGGIGETIEVDVVETRMTNVFEQGVNPVFHPPVAADDLQFNVSQPFGLTYDIGENPKAVQTAVIMTPQSTSPGRWVMCKARARRLYLPELMADSPVKVGTLNGADAYWMPTREDRECAVPVDFSIDFSGLPDVAEAEMSVPKSLALALPAPNPVAANGALGGRYLITWHKARWLGTDEPSWRAQVFLQVAEKDGSAWRTVARKSCYEQTSLMLGLDTDITAWKVTMSRAGSALPFTVRRVLASDYTEAQWISFIGSFGRVLRAPTSYRLRKVAAGLRLDELQYGAWAPAKLALKRPDELTTSFQLLMVYATRSDAMRGLVDETAGEVSGWYQRDPSGNFEPFGAVPGADGQYAYLLSFQRRNAGSAPQFQNWSEVQAGMFPSADEECSVRLLPEYLGPIRIE